MAGGLPSPPERHDGDIASVSEVRRSAAEQKGESWCDLGVNVETGPSEVQVPQATVDWADPTSSVDAAENHDNDSDVPLPSRR